MRALSLMLVAALLLPAPAIGQVDIVAKLVGQSGLLNVPVPDGYRGGCSAGRVGRGRWLSAAHCVVGDDGMPDLSQNYHIDTNPAQILWVDLEHDLVGFTVPADHKRGLKMARTAPKAGDAIVFVGHPLSYPDWMAISGHVANPRYLLPGWKMPYMAYDNVSCQGNSGAPVVNVDGDLVSVLQIGVGLPPCSVLSGGVPYAELKAFVVRFLKMP